MTQVCASVPLVAWSLARSIYGWGSGIDRTRTDTRWSPWLVSVAILKLDRDRSEATIVILWEKYHVWALQSAVTGATTYRLAPHIPIQTTVHRPLPRKLLVVPHVSTFQCHIIQH